MCETTAKSLWPSPASVEGISEHQRGALEVSLSKRVGMLVGSPGTGKTHSTAAVIRQICAQHGSDCVAVAAPTGKAAVRITSFLHTWGIAIEATTIHRLLEVSRNGHDGKGWGFQRSRDFPLSKRFVIVDETSMVDVSLMSSLLEACASGTHVLFVGDKSQLPPVGSGAPLRDFINSGRIPCGELTEIKRNAGLIVHACAKMKDGKPIETAEKIDLAAGQNLHHIETETAEESIEVLRTILAQLRAGDRFDPVWECQVLVAVNAKSQLSRKELNSILQADLNPTGGGATENPFRVRDKVICLKNDSLPISRYQKLRGPETDPAAYLESEDEEFIANGEIGRVLAVAPKLAVMKFSLPDRVYKIHLGKSKDEEDRKSVV